MRSIPIETVEGTDGTYERTVERLIFEELGVPITSNIHIVSGMLYCGYHSVAGILAYTTVEHEFTACPRDHDVAHGGWHSVEEVLATIQDDQRKEPRDRQLRVETAVLIDAYLRHCSSAP